MFLFIFFVKYYCFWHVTLVGEENEQLLCEFGVTVL